VGERALRATGVIDDEGRPIIDPAAGKKTPEQGASTVVFAAASPLLSDIGGVYLLDNDVSVVDAEPPGTFANTGTRAEVAPHAIDPQSAERLWALSERLLA